MNHEDNTIHHFTQAAAVLLQAALNQAHREDREGAEGLAAALRGGASVSLRCTFAPAPGLVHVAINVEIPDGETHQLMAAELQRETHQ